ncbi:cyclophilin, putative [Plasmodium malariae]|uniref:Cyclophilin, putative n=1 Tax=Plasmodium malariae TaxID=5858 RepID=A0A1D3TCY8_PLAMA|nr:cyclophilin, putative [Plasmodium malariae]SCP02711.1 cyclophilin, putative [Plasmodium malariae]
MSEVYSIEPKTYGKVIICTSLGELEVLLFSNECPIACQNFIQLCLNNYYNKNKFFRVIPKFLIQTGDHTNTGLHNEYAFNEPFKNEYNSRLKFLYTGCLSFANLNIDKPSNGSQFFITLDKADYLNNKSTLFGKIAKHSIYNLLKFNNIKTNKNDEPIEDVPYIEYVKIIENPFHHLVPYVNYDNNSKYEKENFKHETLKKKEQKELKSNLLSFAYSDNECVEGDASEGDASEEDASEGDASEGDANEEVVVEGEAHKEEAGEGDASEEDASEGDANEEVVVEGEAGEENSVECEKGSTTSNKLRKDEVYIFKNKKAHYNSSDNNNFDEANTRMKEEKKDKDNSSSMINKKDNNLNLEKINILKKRTNDIVKSNTKKSKNALIVKDLTDLDEEYLKKMKKYNKMSKREREKQSLKKLEEFDNRLKDLFSTEKSDGVMKHDWLNRTGLKFRIDSSSAYEHEDIKKNVIDTMDNERKNLYDSKFNMGKYIKQKGEKKENDK